MASASTSFASTKETTNYARLCRLLVDVGSQALRDTFDRIHPPAGLHGVLARPLEHSTLQSLRKKRILNVTQWGKLYPAIPSSVSSANFDITLLILLLRNICGLTPPITGWGNLPSAADTSVEANVARMKHYRNNVYGHAGQASVDDPTFNTLWQDIGNALVGLGGAGYGAAITNLKTCSMDPDIEKHYQELLKEWKQDEDNLKDKLEKMEDTIRDDLQEIKGEIGSVSKKLKTLKTPATEDEGDFDPIKNINQIRQLYTSREGWLAPFPWCEEFHFHLNDIFTRLVIVSREKKARGTGTRNIVDISAIFQPHEECPKPRKVLIEGKPGMGKTTYCNKVAYDWATEKRKAEDCFLDFKLVLSLKCRDIDIKSDLWEAIDDQLLPREIQKDEREKFFEFIRQNQSNVLLVLDGLDELPTTKLPEFSEIIQGRWLPECHLVVTARHEAGIPVRKVCDTLLEIEGFTMTDAKEFIAKYFKTKENLSEKLLNRLLVDEKLQEMVKNPLNTALLCLVCEDFQGIPQSRTQLYMEIVQCVLTRYREKNGLPENVEDLTEVYKSPLKHLGSIALSGLREDNMHFGEKQLGNHKHDLPGFGFLSVQPGSSKRRRCVSYGFLHKSFQELFAAFYISCQLFSEEISPETLAADPTYFRELREVLFFTCGMLAVQCEETAVALIKSIANEVNKDELTKEYFPVALWCITECKKEESDFHLELARTFGTCLNVDAINLINKELGLTPCAEVLADMLKTNTTLTKLNLSGNELGTAGAEVFADMLKTNTTLTELDLSDNNLGSAGAKVVADMLKTNATLTKLDLSNNDLGTPGAEVLADMLKTNTALTELNLPGNELGTAGAEAFADVLKTNTTLTELDLSDNDLGTAGAKAVADMLKTNTTLTKLDLSYNDLGTAVSETLADKLKTNTTLTKLGLCNSNLGTAHAEVFADLLKTNTTLTELDLSRNNLGTAGAEALADMLKTNTTLTKLNLSRTNLGTAGAEALADTLKTSTTLMVLKCSHN